MDSFEWNKVIGALLVTFLVIFGLRSATDILFEEAPAGGHEVAAVEPAPEPAEVPTAVDAAPADAEPADTEPVAAPVVVAAGSPEAGKKVFRKCGACHSVDQGGKKRIGPNLWAIAGAAKASRDGFAYSSALKAVGGVWDDAALDAWLANPKAFAPGNKMTFGGLKKASDRADLIAYLKSLAE